MTTVYYIHNTESDRNEYFGTKTEFEAAKQVLIDEEDGNEDFVREYFDFYELDVPYSVGEPLTMEMMVRLLSGGTDYKVKAI